MEALLPRCPPRCMESCGSITAAGDISPLLQCVLHGGCISKKALDEDLSGLLPRPVCYASLTQRNSLNSMSEASDKPSAL